MEENNATWFHGVEGRPNLFTAFQRYLEAERAYDKPESTRYWKEPENILKWAQTSPKCALRFAVGQVVKYCGNGLVSKIGHYGIVESYVTSNYYDLYVKFTDGSYKVDWRTIEDAEIPAEIVEIASKAKAGVDWGLEPLKAKCPFRDEYKEPVPPCMKKEGE